MSPDERTYYQSRSKQDSVVLASWCFVIMVVLIAAAGIAQLIQWWLA